MVRGMREHNGTDPDLIEGEDSFTVRPHAGSLDSDTTNRDMI